MSVWDDSNEKEKRDHNTLLNFYSHTSRVFNTATTLTISAIALYVSLATLLTKILESTSLTLPSAFLDFFIFMALIFYGTVFYGFVRIAELSFQLQVLEDMIPYERCTLHQFVSNMPRLKCLHQRAPNHSKIQEIRNDKRRRAFFRWFGLQHLFAIIAWGIIFGLTLCFVSSMWSLPSMTCELSVLQWIKVGVLLWTVVFSILCFAINRSHHMAEIEISSKRPPWVQHPDCFGYADPETGKVWIKLGRQSIGKCELSDEQWMVRAVVHEILHLYVNPEIVEIQKSRGVAFDNCYNELVIDLLAQWSTTPENLDVGAALIVAAQAIDRKLFDLTDYGKELRKLLSDC